MSEQERDQTEIEQNLPNLINLLALRFIDGVITDNNPSTTNGLNSLDQFLVFFAVHAGEGNRTLPELRELFYESVREYANLMTMEDEDEYLELSDKQEDMLATYEAIEDCYDNYPDTIEEYIKVYHDDLDYLAQVLMFAIFPTDNPSPKNKLDTFQQFVLFNHHVDEIYGKRERDMLFDYIYGRHLAMRGGTDASDFFYQKSKGKLTLDDIEANTIQVY